jgi:hypothetical protein
MEILILCIGIVIALALILWFMSRRSRRSGHRVGFDESRVTNDRYRNDSRAQQP